MIISAAKRMTKQQALTNSNHLEVLANQKPTNARAYRVVIARLRHIFGST